MKNDRQHANKNFNQCMARLQHAMPTQNDKKLVQLVNDFDQDPLAIELLISYLTHWHNGQLVGLEHIPVLHNNQKQDRSLRRMLSAFEYKFTDSAELTLLYLLSLSTKPVPQPMMEQLFKRTLKTKLFARNNEYQKFLAPLSRLSSRGWKKVVTNLYTLNLLNQSDSAQGKLLAIETRICHYFLENLRTQKYRIWQDAYDDILTATSETQTYAMPASFSSKAKTSTRKTVSPLRARNTRKQLKALRHSLEVIQQQTLEINALLQARTPGPSLTGSSLSQAA